MKDPHLITVDELRAAGALDVPASWRKSLVDERDLFSGLFGEENPTAEESLTTADYLDQTDEE